MTQHRKDMLRAPRTARGFTLIEVLVALVIFAIGLLGLAGLQSQSLKFNYSAFLRTQASFLAYDILDRMRANPEQATLKGNFAYNIGLDEDAADESCVDVNSPATLECTVTQLVNADLTEWKESLDALLPDGQGEIDVREQPGGSGIFVARVRVRWSDPAAPNGSTEFEMRSEL